MHYRLCLDPNAQGGGGNPGSGSTLLTGAGGNPGQQSTPTWRDTLPEDLRKEPSLANINDVASLAKGYVHAQRLVGADKILKPRDDWKPEQWSEFYKSIGRPEKPEEYEFQTPEGFKPDEASMAEWRKRLYDLGLTKTQAKRMVEEFWKEQTSALQKHQKLQEERLQTWEQETKNLFGNRFDEAVNLSRYALKEFGSKELIDLLEESGFGNHPQVVQFFSKVGQAMAERSPAGGPGSGARSVTMAPEQAQAALVQFRQDREKMAALHDARHQAHDQAVKEHFELMRLAYPVKNSQETP